MTEINFQPVFDYIDQNNHVLKEDILFEVRAGLREIRTDVANLAGQVKDFHDEMSVMGFRVNRLETWAGPAGKKLNLPLEL